jgi:hypothetical protein
MYQDLQYVSSSELLWGYLITPPAVECGSSFRSSLMCFFAVESWFLIPKHRHNQPPINAGAQLSTKKGGNKVSAHTLALSFSTLSSSTLYP